MNIVPSSLYRAKTFESVETFRIHQGGRQRLLAGTESIEKQIDAWVDATHSLIAGAGPLSLFEVSEDDGTIVLTRTLVIVYVPAMEQSDELYGQSAPQNPTAAQPGADRNVPGEITAGTGGPVEGQ